MSLYELDGDLSRWPTNPYELLGVRPDVSPRDLRRAYVQRIRAFKPEQYPEHFRRIRDAYEIVQRFTQLFGQQGGSGESSPAEMTPAPVSANHEPQPASSSGPPARSFHEQLQALWETACLGEAATAYQKMVELSGLHPDPAALCLRLYWLLLLWPDLDSQRSRCDWLTQGLRASGLTGPLCELYRREIDSDPEEGVGHRCGQLLACPVRFGLLADLVERRWQAAGRLHRWHILRADLELLRSKWAREDDESWARLLLTAVEHLAWAEEQPGRDLLEACVLEVRSLSHLAMRLDRDLDRLDLLTEVVSAWQVLRKEWPALARLIPLSWTRPFAEYRPQVLSWIESVVRQPLQTLTDLDRVLFRCPEVFAQLGTILSQFQRTVPALTVPPLDEIRELILGFVAVSRWPHYEEFRLELLVFCFREQINPDQVAQVLEESPSYWVDNAARIPERVREDWPLQHVYLARRLFWA